MKGLKRYKSTKILMIKRQTGTNCTQPRMEKYLTPLWLVQCSAAECRQQLRCGGGGRSAVMSNGRRWGADGGPDTQHYRYTQPPALGEPEYNCFKRKLP